MFSELGLGDTLAVDGSLTAGTANSGTLGGNVGLNVAGQHVGVGSVGNVDSLLDGKTPNTSIAGLSLIQPALQSVLGSNANVNGLLGSFLGATKVDNVLGPLTGLVRPFLVIPRAMIQQIMNTIGRLGGQLTGRNGGLGGAVSGLGSGLAGVGQQVPGGVQNAVGGVGALPGNVGNLAGAVANQGSGLASIGSGLQQTAGSLTGSGALGSLFG